MQQRVGEVKKALWIEKANSESVLGGVRGREREVCCTEKVSSTKEVSVWKSNGQPKIASTGLAAGWSVWTKSRFHIDGIDNGSAHHGRGHS